LRWLTPIDSQSTSELDLLFLFTLAFGQRLFIRNQQASLNYFFYLRWPSASAYLFAINKRA
jgi:hypothetical protein